MRAIVRTQSSNAVRGDDAELEHAVVGTCILERLDAGEQLADVPEEDAARLALEPRRPVDLDRASNGFRPSCLTPVQTYATRPIRSFSPRRPRGSSARRSPPRHHREPLAVHAPHVEPAASAVQPDLDRLSMSCGISRLDAKRFAVPAGRSRRERRAVERVDAALHHAVAAPDEEEVGPLLDRLARPAPAPCGSSAPRTRADRTPCRSSSRRSSSRPPPKVLPACATTATCSCAARLPPRATTPVDTGEQQGRAARRSR